MKTELKLKLKLFLEVKYHWVPLLKLNMVLTAMLCYYGVIIHGSL